MGWIGECMVQLKAFSRSHINIEIEGGEGLPRWRFTRFYGSPNERGRESL